MGTEFQFRVNRAIGFGLAASMLLVFGGCATTPKPFPIYEASPGIFAGKKPWGKAGFETLHACGVRTILNLECMPWDIWPEHWQARRQGFEFRSVPIVAAPFPPGERSVKKALGILNDPSLRPVYVHCYLGDDRTAFLIALYRVCFEGWAPEAAWKEMLNSGFHIRYTLRGLSSYFWRHTDNLIWAESHPVHKPP